MAEEKRERTQAKEKKPNAYDVPFNTAKKSPAPAQKASDKKPDDAPAKKASDAPAKDKPARAPATQRSVRNASDAPDKKAPARKEASTATSKKPPERKSSERKEKKEDDRPRSMRPAHRALPYVFIVGGAFIGITLILNLFCNLGNKLEAIPTEHWMGIVGYGISLVLNGLFGPAVLVFPVLLIVLGIFWRRYVDHKVAVSKIIATFIFLITFGAIFHIFNLIVEPGIRGGLPASELFAFGAQSLGGGLLGGAFGHLLYSLCRFVGALIVAFLILAISLFICWA